MSKYTNDDHKKWYEENRPKYGLLSTAVKTTLESLIKNAGIPFLSIATRAKEVDSFADKIRNKSYKNPAQEVTDLAGIRVITFIEADALKVNELIRNSFDVDDSKSLDKSNELGIDKFGYRSFHFICGLGEARCALPEFENFKDLVFEIQVRTVLQHAWAEIEHDRNYKFAGDLPNLIKRRLHLLAGLLELADGEFNKLSIEIDDYSEDSRLKTESGNLDIEINSISLKQYFSESKNTDFIVSALIEAGFGNYISESDESLISVVRALNISTIKEIDEILNSSKSWMKKYFSDILESHQSFTDSSWDISVSFATALIIMGDKYNETNRKIFNRRLKWDQDITNSIFNAAKKIEK